MCVLERGGSKRPLWVIRNDGLVCICVVPLAAVCFRLCVGVLVRSVGCCVQPCPVYWGLPLVVNSPVSSAGLLES
jgi:hypothetical protein